MRPAMGTIFLVIGEKEKVRQINRDETMNFYCLIEAVALFFSLGSLHFSIVQFLLLCFWFLKLAVVCI